MPIVCNNIQMQDDHGARKTCDLISPICQSVFISKIYDTVIV